VLLEGANKLISDPTYKQNAKKIGDSFDEAGGMGPAVDAVEEVPSLYVKHKKHSASNLRMEILHQWTDTVTKYLNSTESDVQ